MKLYDSTICRNAPSGGSVSTSYPHRASRSLSISCARATIVIQQAFALLLVQILDPQRFRFVHRSLPVLKNGCLTPQTAVRS